jgi:hypothetical protein
MGLIVGLIEHSFGWGVVALLSAGVVFFVIGSLLFLTLGGFEWLRRRSGTSSEPSQRHLISGKKLIAWLFIGAMASSGCSGSHPLSDRQPLGSTTTIVVTSTTAVQSVPSHPLSPWPATSPSWRSGVCEETRMLVGVFFLPTASEADVQAVEAVVHADLEAGLVGFVDQAAGYQEFLTLFRGTDSEDKLAQQDIPPSLRVFTDTTELPAWQSQVQAMSGVLRVTTSSAEAMSSAPELDPIAGLFDIGTIVYQQPSWKSSCVLRPWSLNHPVVV